MRVAVLQLRVDDTEPWQERLERVVALVEAQRGAELVVLPELWLPGAFNADLFADVATDLDGPIVARFSQAARRIDAYLMAGTFIERPGAVAAEKPPAPARHLSPDSQHPAAPPQAAGSAIGHNTAVLFGPDGEILHVYRKVHLFGFDEGEVRLLVPGNEVRVCPLPGLATYGTSTCYDVRFPELYRILVDQGCDLLVIPSGWPASRLEHWQILTRARAIENQLFLIGCNETGVQGGVELGGHSVVIDPWGRVVAEAGSEEEILHVDIDMSLVKKIRNEFPVLRDRRLR
ncbi:MAG: carbon-nitrogen family hydrolase [Acidothermus sp.]|nr:carbon-nitrogen family hydrolase [Acidothermus sp.]MCL6537318.1 carbon-nitrogen family hydrolase [Acidothermus sp.]